MAARLLYLVTILGLILVGSLTSYGADRIILLDPGHGGIRNAGTQAGRTLSSSNNAVSPGGILEKDLTLDLCLEIQKQIRSIRVRRQDLSVDCVLTRNDDTNPDFAARAAICDSVGPKLVAIVSVHFNASTNHRAMGTLAVLARPENNPNYAADQQFATLLVQATSKGVSKFIPASKPLQCITDAHLHGGAGSNFFFQLAQFQNLQLVPKCFLEVEFMDRPDVEQNLLLNRSQTFPILAKQIAHFLHSYCGSTRNIQPKKVK